MEGEDMTRERFSRKKKPGLLMQTGQEDKVSVLVKPAF